MEYFTLKVTWPESRGEGEPYRLKLSPRYDRIAKRLEKIDVEVDSEAFIPVLLRYREPSGDDTEYTFTDIRVDVPIPPEEFELHLPPEVVVRVRQQP